MKLRTAGLAIALVFAGLVALGHAKDERPKPSEYLTEYLTFERVVYTGDTLWDVCQKYAGYEDIQTVIERARMDNGITNPGLIQPGTKIKIRVKK